MEINKPVSTIIILVIALILFFLFAWPKYQESLSLETALAQKQAEYNGQAAYHTNLSQLLSKIEEHKDVLNTISSALPNTFALAPIVYFFQKTGTQSGVMVRSVSFSQGSAPSTRPAAATATPIIKDVSLTINFMGNYQGLKNFISTLETSARIFEISAISLVPIEATQGTSSSQNQSRTYEMKMDVVTHTY